MIEIIYKDDQEKEKKDVFKIPNNIRQIGEWKGHQKIYIEDYAYTFLKKVSRDANEGGKAAILLGSHHWDQECSYLFIKSAFLVENMEVSPEHIVFSDKVWGEVYEGTKKYFPDQEIVGWYVSLPGFNMQINEVLLKTHLNHFAGSEKTLFLVEPGEWEEAFFMYENNQLVRQPGYYIYYEKNDAMRSYMIDMSKNKSIEETEKIPDRAVADFRKTVKEKSAGKKTEREQCDGTEQGQKNKKDPYVSWMAGACAAVAVFTVGMIYFNNNMGISADQGIGQEAKTEPEETVEVSAPGQSLWTEKSEMDDVPKTDEYDTITGERKPEDVIQNVQDDREMEDQEEKERQENIEMEETSIDSMVQVEEYIIQRGDTLTSICKSKYGNMEKMDEICELNGILPEDIIYAGKKLILPD